MVEMALNVPDSTVTSVPSNPIGTSEKVNVSFVVSPDFRLSATELIVTVGTSMVVSITSSLTVASLVEFPALSVTVAVTLYVPSISASPAGIERLQMWAVLL